MKKNTYLNYYSEKERNEQIPQKISKEEVMFVIETLFPTEKNNQKLFNDIKDFIDMQFYYMHSCVFYNLNSDLNEMLRKHNLEIGKQELIITSKHKFLYGKDFQKSLKEIKKF